jgi:hypothetical protein
LFERNMWAVRTLAHAADRQTENLDKLRTCSIEVSFKF